MTRGPHAVTFVKTVDTDADWLIQLAHREYADAVTFTPHADGTTRVRMTFQEFDRAFEVVSAVTEHADIVVHLGFEEAALAN